uniref:C2H2-type domain-containing protein n=1 Tax=Globodera pallida TaxID=36090 RepID=A0A183CLM4_GLOPA
MRNMRLLAIQYEKEHKAVEQRNHCNFGEEHEEEDEDESEEEEDNSDEEEAKDGNWEEEDGHKEFTRRPRNILLNSSSVSSTTSSEEDESSNDDQGEDESDDDDDKEEDDNLEEEQRKDGEEHVVERVLAKRINKNGEAEYLKKPPNLPADTQKDGGNLNIVNASSPVSSKRSLRSSLLRLILSIDLFERRRFINGCTKALCKLCGDSMGVDLETLIRHIVSDKDPHHQPYAFKLLQKQLELGFPIKSSETPPALVLTEIGILQFVRAIWAIDLFERRRFINGRTKVLCKLCGDSLWVDLEALIRHIATNEDLHHQPYAVKLLKKQLDSAIAQPPRGEWECAPQHN